MAKKKVKNGKRSVIKSCVVLSFLVVGICLLFVPLFSSLKFGLDLQGGFEILYKASSIDGSKMNSEKLKATYKTLSKRIDSLGVSEPEIILEGNDMIRVKLAGVKNPEEARSQLSTVATLSFRDTEDNLLMGSEVLRAGGAKIGQDGTGNPAVALAVKDKDKFYDVTSKVSKQDNNQIVIWLDYNGLRNSYEKERGQCGTSGSNCLSAATVSQGFASDVIIQGDFTQDEVSNLVDLINSGSLPSKLTEISSNTVGASFGDQTLQTTLIAGIIAVAAIMIILIFIYHFSGVISSISMLIYTFLVFGVFWVVGGVLTLPGIAALVLGIGMAVDSNVITFSRIQDELRKGKSLPSAFKEGSKSSFSAIIDSNITTLIVALIMFVFGESSIKGFATMLIITVAVTMFTMVFLTRTLLSLFVKSDFFNDKTNLFIHVKKEEIPNVSKGEKVKPNRFHKVNFFKHKKAAVWSSLLLILVGAIVIGIGGLNLGLDYKGGTAISIISDKEISDKELTTDFNKLDYKIEKIVRDGNDEVTVRIKDTLKGRKVSELNDLLEERYQAKVNIGVVSNLVQKELVKNAVLSVLITLLGIIVYISIRFKFSYALGGVLALLHDIAIMFGLFAIFRLEVNPMFIAAVLAIIGYSINDTIISFDRIRENLALWKKKLDAERLEEICNRSIQETFTRTIYTTSTTLLPVIILIFLGSSGIFTFNMAMLIGLVVGTYSSIFIATLSFMAIEKRNLGKPKKAKKIYRDDIEELEVKGINS